MRQLVTHYTTWIWLLLLVLTLTSWEVGSGLGADPGHAVVTTALMVVAFFKVRLVGLHFMELKIAPLPLRALFEAWVVIVCILVLAIYFHRL